MVLRFTYHINCTRAGCDNVAWWRITQPTDAGPIEYYRCDADANEIEGDREPIEYTHQH